MTRASYAALDWGTRGLCVLVLLSLAACYPGTVEDVSEFGTVTTLYNPNEDFSSNQTFFMPDTVVHLCDQIDAGADCVPITRLYDGQLLLKIANDMEDLGYTRISNPDPDNPPDLVLLVSAVATENWAATGGYCYGWWGYGGYYPPYPCYYPPTVVEYNTGTLLLTLASTDSTASAGSDTGPLIWVAGINGVLEGSASENYQAALTGINQAFEQSPYLEVNP